MAITNKLLNLFLVFLYKWHTEEYGETISTLKEGGFDLVDDLFASENPEAVANLNEDDSKGLTHTLAEEAEARGYVEIEGITFTLTEKGFYAAQRLLYPVKGFLEEHWKWIVGSLFTFITILLAVIRLTKCP